MKESGLRGRRVKYSLICKDARNSHLVPTQPSFGSGMATLPYLQTNTRYGTMLTKC